MENKMEQVAQLLGVTIGETFQIDKPGSLHENVLYRFTHYGLECEINHTWAMAPHTFLEILRGNAEIVKAAWQPKAGNRYFYVKLDGSIGSTVYDNFIYLDRVNMILGNCYRTPGDAKADAEPWKAYFAICNPMDVLHIGEQEGAK